MTPTSRLVLLFSSHPELSRVLLIVAAALAAMTVLTTTFGVHPSALSYHLIPDPAAGLPF